MFKQIRTSKATKVIACYLALMIFIQLTQPLAAYALTEGPSQPEFNSFTPIGTSDMVDLASGDFNYNIPIMDVGGYPINLAYNSGVTMDQEASWVGLGWNLNVGQINRNVRGLPDDFKGDEIITENNIKPNVTVGVNGNINWQIVGLKDANENIKVNAGLQLSYNNYEGIFAKPSLGFSFDIHDNVSVGMSMSSSMKDGVSLSPSVSIHSSESKAKSSEAFKHNQSASLNYNSRQSLSEFNLSSSFSQANKSGNFVQSGRSSSSMSFMPSNFTPSKRLAYNNLNLNGSFSYGPEAGVTGVEFTIGAYGSIGKLRDKIKVTKSYGYEHTEVASNSDLKDFNREKEQSSVNENTLALPVTNYTYDIYSIQGQALNGQFRPYRSQIGYVYDPYVEDISNSGSAGIELQGGAGVHIGGNIKYTNSRSYTNNWDGAPVSNFLKEKTKNNAKGYEKVYYKLYGDSKSDIENQNLNEFLGSNDPITLTLDFNKNATNSYAKKELVDNHSTFASALTTFNSPIKRENREKRTQTVQKFAKNEVSSNSLLSKYIENNEFSKGHHTSGFIINDINGNRHVYGESAYNIDKQEVTFAVGNNFVDYNKWLVNYGLQDISIDNNKGNDKYFSKTITPPFAHTYLISSILSNDYQDLTNNGITDDDLGSYTKFIYETKSDNYQWRVPYTKASYNEGFKSRKGEKGDDKGNFLYGKKELKYVTKIITKTHVAFIDLEERKDGIGVAGINGGRGQNADSRMYLIKSIRLYSKPEVSEDGVIVDPLMFGQNSDTKPIKTAHFVYDYSLSPNIENNSGAADSDPQFELNNNAKGKLTLKKVYFTYGKSNMGKYTPYVFEYNTLNPSYHSKAYDVWGNYKPFVSGSHAINHNSCTPQEFPYVDQSNKELADSYASAWSLSSIQLPSGGKIQVSYESDDYKFVQNKRAVQMFKVDGVTNEEQLNTYDPNGENEQLYDSSFEAEYIAIELDENDTKTIDENTANINYLGELKGKSIYYDFLVNITPILLESSINYEHITGYFEMPPNAKIKYREISGRKFIFVPMQKVNREGKKGASASKDCNPISLETWFFGRNNLYKEVYGVNNEDFGETIDLLNVSKTLVNEAVELITLFVGSNTLLRTKKVGKDFKKNKSWIRLQEPTGAKLGGGVRVKSVTIYDEWDKMMDTEVPINQLDRYSKKYGQSYNYKLDDGTSSGVATYEPNMSKENPHVLPFYHNQENRTVKVYEELPFGESMYPAATVTYSKVTVSNIVSSDTEATSKSRTGKVVTEHYTTYDFPVITDYTPLNNDLVKNIDSNEKTLASTLGNLVKGLLGAPIEVRNKLTISQGFSVQINDMNGKLKKQTVFNEGGSEISSIEYKYSTNPDKPNELLNKLPVIYKDGSIEENQSIGEEFDVVNDLRVSNSYSKTFGVAGNVNVTLSVPPIILGMCMPEYATHQSELKTSTTTKVINRKGILVETIARDLGAQVSTKNLAWEADTGDVLLREVTNEFDDRFYSFDFPAYWGYDSMGFTSNNIDLSGVFHPIPMEVVNGINYYKDFGYEGEISNYLKPGDELLMTQPSFDRVWVEGYSSDLKGVSLIKSNGDRVAGTLSFNAGFGSYTFTSNRPFYRVFRSSFKNLIKSSMASITMMKNPIRNTNGSFKSSIGGSFDFNGSYNPLVINASAIEYSDYWESLCENDLPSPTETPNKYLYNVKGVWRPNKSYAYLTGRNATPNTNIRTSGSYTSFNLFYKLDASNKWIKDPTNLSKWTYASEVTRYNPYGVEIENKDALNRYSSAQYGYNYTLPEAVASNAKYEEMGFESFEDNHAINWGSASINKHFHFNNGLDASDPTSVQITDKESHTGRKSIMVNPYNRAILSDKDKRNCGSFKLTTQKKYIISGWVKHADISNVVNNLTYILIDGNQFYANGPIIEGWQRISGEFVYSGTNFTMELKNDQSSSISYFDDIRIHPYNSNLKSFVYDYRTQKLMAELDENNFATFYEYDQEGGLIRVKKETEKGVYTIQETRSSNPKK